MPLNMKVAIIATSNALMGDGAEPTGVWLEELTTPYYEMIDAGLDVTVYSITGGEIPIDPRSLASDDEKAESVERYESDAQAQAKFKSTKPVEQVVLDDYAAIFLPGGHGTMWDYPTSESLAGLVAAALEQEKFVAAVCHGPAGLVSARRADGTPVVAGLKVAGFTNTEEDAVGLTEAVPFLLETRLKALGADYVSGPDFEPFAVRDGWLITGQNPASAEPTVKHLIDALKEG